jgi:hypothetical protein
MEEINERINEKISEIESCLREIKEIIYYSNLSIDNKEIPEVRHAPQFISMDETGLYISGSEVRFGVKYNKHRQDLSIVGWKECETIAYLEDELYSEVEYGEWFFVKDYDFIYCKHPHGNFSLNISGSTVSSLSQTIGGNNGVMVVRFF